MGKIRRVANAGLVLATSGCCLLPQQTKDPGIVPVSEVINKVKDELNAYMSIPPQEVTVPADAPCKGDKGSVVIAVQPKIVKLTLKTVLTKENDPSVGLGSPLGVLSIDPSYSGAYSRSNAQSLEVDLNIASTKPGSKPDLSKYPLAKAIVEFQNQLLKVDHRKTPCLKPTDLIAKINFDVVDQTKLGLGITLGVFKLGDKIVLTDEYHQTLEVDFKMEGSTTMFKTQ